MMADSTDENGDGRDSESPIDQNTYHKAEEELQDHILAIYGQSNSKNDLFRPALADNTKIGFFSLDRASQTEVTEIVDLKEMTEVLQILLQDVANLRRDINFTKHVMQADHDSKLQEKSLELYCRINEKVVELEKVHQDRVNSLRKAFRQQLADAISRLSVHFSKNLQSKLVREKTKQKSDLADKEEKFREMQATILRNEGVIQMLKTQLQQQQQRKQEEEDARFMDRRIIMDDSSPRVDSALQEQLGNVQEELEEATQKIEKGEKKIKRLEESIDIKDDEILTLHKELDAMKEQCERSDIMVQQLKHEQTELIEAAAKEKETTQKVADDLLGHQKEEMKRMMEEQLRLARDEAATKVKEEAEKAAKEAANAELLKANQLKSQMEALEKQLMKEKEKSSMATQDSISSKTLKESEDRLKSEVLRLQSEVEKAHKTWEKKFAILQQSMHALKDESYLRQTLQRQAAQLHTAAVSYSVDMPAGQKAPASSPLKKPLPDIRRGSKGGAPPQDKDYISYTVSAPSGRGTAQFSQDENQIMSDNEIDMIPPDMEPLPEPPSRKATNCGVDSRPSTGPNVVVLPSVAAK